MKDKLPEGLDINELTKVVPPPKGGVSVAPPPPVKKEKEKKEPEKKELEKKEPAEVKAPKGWITFTEETQGFSVLVPVKPEQTVNDQTKETLNKAGLGIAKSPIHFPASTGGLNPSYNVEVVSLPPEKAKLKPDAVFNLVESGYNQMFKRLNVEMKVGATKSSNPPGREWELGDGKSTLIFLRAYLVNDRLYILSVSGSRSTHPSPETRAFFNSFKTLSR